MRACRGWLLALPLALAGCEGDPPLTLGITATEHEPYFPVAEGAPHALEAAAFDGPITCVSCHGGKDSFREFHCLRCHEHDATPLGTAHGAVAGYLPQDVSCFSCHPTGQREADNGVATHSDQFFPIDPEDPHGGDLYDARIGADQTSCSACHASETDRSVVLCAECHASDAPSLFTAHQALSRSFVNESVACKECHAETPINPVMSPLSAHEDIFDPNHFGAECKDCHNTFRAAPKEWAIDFTAAVCTRCHGAACTVANQGACN